MLLFAKTSAGVSTDINARNREARDGARRSSRFPCVCFAVCVLISVRCVQAADDIAMTAARIQAIGIELQKLDTPARASGLAYPARAVLPRDKEQLVSAAVAGMVDQILVEDHAEVVRGQPLIRINSPEFGDLQLKLLEATNQARLAASTLAREKGLFAEGIIPKRRVIEAESAASTARATEQHARAAHARGPVQIELAARLELEILLLDGVIDHLAQRPAKGGGRRLRVHQHDEQIGLHLVERRGREGLKGYVHNVRLSSFHSA